MALLAQALLARGDSSFARNTYAVGTRLRSIKVVEQVPTPGSATSTLSRPAL
jgi:hypothetical protein